jgi:hypothetical protein
MPAKTGRQSPARVGVLCGGSEEEIESQRPRG